MLLKILLCYFTLCLLGSLSLLYQPPVANFICRTLWVPEWVFYPLSVFMLWMSPITAPIIYSLWLFDLLARKK